MEGRSNNEIQQFTITPTGGTIEKSKKDGDGGSPKTKAKQDNGPLSLGWRGSHRLCWAVGQENLGLPMLFLSFYVYCPCVQVPSLLVSPVLIHTRFPSFGSENRHLKGQYTHDLTIPASVLVLLYVRVCTVDGSFTDIIFWPTTYIASKNK